MAVWARVGDVGDVLVEVDSVGRWRAVGVFVAQDALDLAMVQFGPFAALEGRGEFVEPRCREWRTRTPAKPRQKPMTGHPDPGAFEPCEGEEHAREDGKRCRVRRHGQAPCSGSAR